MHAAPWIRRVAMSALVIAMVTPAVHAQGLAGRVAVEGIASASSQARELNDPNVILDLVGTVRVGDGWDIIVRPWSMRRPGGDWMFEMYQLQVRYVSSTPLPFASMPESCPRRWGSPRLNWSPTAIR